MIKYNKYTVIHLPIPGIEKGHRITQCPFSAAPASALLLSGTFLGSKKEATGYSCLCIKLSYYYYTHIDSVLQCTLLLFS